MTDQPAPPAQDGDPTPSPSAVPQTATSPVPRPVPESLTVRPRRITVYAAVASGIVLISMVVIGLVLRGTSRGVQFRVADQVGLIGVGILVAAGIMTAARPRLVADAAGMRVRNIFGERFFGWGEVVRIAFPPGAQWAQLLLPDDEVHALMAIQAMDKQRAVEALEAVRAMHARFGPSAPPEPTADAVAARERDAREAYRRPLGRLEIIDQQKAGRTKAGRRSGSTDPNG